MLEWIKEAELLPKIARESNLFGKKVAAERVFGSNLILAGRQARQWAALCAAHELALKKPSSFVLVGREG